jgi:transcription antitermination factor NusG
MSQPENDIAMQSIRPWSEIVAELMDAHRARRGPRWHLAQVASHARDLPAAERLGRHYEAYCPLERCWQPVPRHQLSRRQREMGVTRMQEMVRPMFPRYLFCRFDPAGNWHDIFRITGVKGLVVRQGLPVPISDDLVASLRANEVDGAIPGDIPAINVFRVGQWVEINDGPFANLRGEIQKIRAASLDGIDAALRITVAIELFGRLTPVDLDAAVVSPANR